MDVDFAWDDLFDYIRSGELAVVLGPELLQATYEGRQVSLQRVLAERLAANEKLAVEWAANAELNDAVSAYLDKPRAKPDSLYPFINRTLRDLSPPFPIPPALSQLATIAPLDLFVSLTFDSLMARALTETRADCPLKEISFSINQTTEAHNQALKAPPRGVPVVFNLLGRASQAASYALHDEDILEYVHKWVSGDVAVPDWLLSELRRRHLLLIGVHWPDWLSRFVLRAATSKRLMDAQRMYFIASDANSGTPISSFLERFGRGARISAYPGSALEFVSELQRRWLAEAPAVTLTPTAAGAVSPEPRKGSIFISYGRENLEAVHKLHRSIVELGGDAWFDQEELSAGDRWERKILPQIQRDVQLFVPVISERTAARDEGYVFREWREAIERSKGILNRKFIVPVVVDAELDLKRYRGLLDAFPAFSDLHFGHAPNGEPDAALSDSLKLTIRALRRETSW